jgi:hypothetical protein
LWAASAAILAGCAGDDAEVAGQAGAQVPGQAQAPGAAPKGIVDPYREILVIGPSPRFDAAKLPENWYAATSGSGTPNFETGRKDGVFALRLSSDGDGAILGRRIEVPLLNMPYLRWGWYLDPPAPAAKRTAAGTGGESSVLLRIVVGFRDGAAPKDEEKDSHTPPKIDRAISLEWRADDAPQAGTAGTVAMRAGRREAGRWLIEAVDLTRIYSQAWPQSPMGNTHIAFVAVGAGPSRTPASGYVAEVVLSP